MCTASGAKWSVNGSPIRVDTAALAITMSVRPFSDGTVIVASAAGKLELTANT